MISTLRLITALIIFLFVVACDKADFYKNPAQVSFDFELDTTGQAGADLLTINDGYIVLSKFSVIGTRNQATDFEFNRSFDNGLKVPLNDLTRLWDLQFDLPQGIYEKITIRLETVNNVATNLFFSGEYIFNPIQNYRADVHLELEGINVFELEITDVLGNKNIQLDEKTSTKPQIIATPKKLFINVNQTDLNNAPIHNVNQKRTIIINKNNSDLTMYNAITMQLNKLFDVKL